MVPVPSKKIIYSGNSRRSSRSRYLQSNRVHPNKQKISKLYWESRCWLWGRYHIRPLSTHRKYETHLSKMKRTTCNKYLDTRELMKDENLNTTHIPNYTRHINDNLRTDKIPNLMVQPRQYETRQNQGKHEETHKCKESWMKDRCKKWRTYRKRVTVWRNIQTN